MNRRLKTHFCCLIAAMLLTIAITPHARSQEEKKKKKGGDNSPVSMLTRALMNAGLSEEQNTKVKALTDEYGPKIAKAQSQISNELRREMAEARKKASDEGKKGKDLRDAVEAKVKLTDEQKAAQAESQKLVAELREKVSALLTEEQREKAGLKQQPGQGKKKKAA